MRLKLFILLFVTVLVGAAAKDIDQKLTETQLSEMLKKYQKDLYINGQIKQEKLIKELGLTLKSEGLFEVNKSAQKDLTIDWKILKPEVLHVCIEGANIYIKDPQQKKPLQQDLTQMSQQGQESMATLKSLMDMDTARLFKDFTISKRKEMLILKNDKLVVELLVSSSGLMKQIKFTETNGDELKINFLNVKNLKATHVKIKTCSERMDSKAL